MDLWNVRHQRSGEARGGIDGAEMNIKLIAAALSLVVVAALCAVAYARGAAHVQTEFDAFKEVQQILAAKQREQIEALKKERDAQRQQLEIEHAKNVAIIRARYDAELGSLRNQLSAGAGGVSTVTPTPALCANSSDDDRLSEPIRQFRIGVRQLLEECDLQAATLTTCQTWVKSLR